MPQQKGTINEYKNLLYKKQYTYLKVLQLRYCGRDSIIQVRNRPYFHYGPFGRTKNKWRWFLISQLYEKSYLPRICFMPIFGNRWCTKVVCHPRTCSNEKIRLEKLRLWGTLTSILTWLISTQVTEVKKLIFFSIFLP